MKSTSSPAVTVDVSYADYKAFYPYWYPGYTGLLRRLVQAKELLDDQASYKLTIIKIIFVLRILSLIVTLQSQFIIIMFALALIDTSVVFN